MKWMDWRQFELASKSFFEAHLNAKLLEHIPIQLMNGEKHKFDLISNDGKIVVECKSHRWTKSGRYPSAKVSDAQNSVELLHKCKASRKILVLQDHTGPSGSLVDVFVRRNQQKLLGIEVWRYSDAGFIEYAKFPAVGDVDSESRDETTNKVDATVGAIDAASQILLSYYTSHSPRTAIRVSIFTLAQHLGVSADEVVRTAPQVCRSLEKVGMTPKFDGQEFFVCGS